MWCVCGISICCVLYLSCVKCVCLCVAHVYCTCGEGLICAMCVMCCSTDEVCIFGIFVVHVV